jgi:putative transposase
MRSGRVCNAISLPCPSEGDHQFTQCEPSSMRSSMCCARVARGATCQPTSRPGKRCSTIIAVCAIPGTWFRLLMVLREAERERVGRNAQPSAAIMDAQSVKTVEESAGICGFDAHTCVKGRKRHILVDTLGLLLAVYVTPADLHDGKGARCLLAGLAPLYSRLKKIWADAAYRGQELAVWCQAEGGWELEVVEREPGTRGFSILPRRRVVERTFNWISRA